MKVLKPSPGSRVVLKCGLQTLLLLVHCRRRVRRSKETNETLASDLMLWQTNVIICWLIHFPVFYEHTFVAYSSVLAKVKKEVFHHRKCETRSLGKCFSAGNSCVPLLRRALEMPFVGMLGAGVSTEARDTVKHSTMHRTAPISKTVQPWNFPSGPVVKTSPSSSGGCRFDPWLGSQDSIWLSAKKPKHKTEVIF